MLIVDGSKAYPILFENGELFMHFEQTLPFSNSNININSLIQSFKNNFILILSLSDCIYLKILFFFFLYKSKNELNINFSSVIKIMLNVCSSVRLCVIYENLCLIYNFIIMNKRI